MPTTTTCPSCHGPLRIPDELVGQRVRCPVCRTIFEAAGAPTAPSPEPERPLWKDLQLELDKSDPGRSQSAPGPEPEPVRKPAPPRLVGAVEVQPTGDEPSVPPPPRPSGPPRREDLLGNGRRDDPTDDGDRPRRSPYDRGPRRRDAEPHRGALILVLGIISMVCVALTFCSYGLFGLVGIPLGVTAWVLGHIDLGKIKRQEMDEDGLGITQAGWICGILGTALNSLVLLTCGGLVTFLIISSNNAPTGAKTPFGVPSAPAPAAAPQP